MAGGEGASALTAADEHAAVPRLAALSVQPAELPPTSPHAAAVRTFGKRPANSGLKRTSLCDAPPPAPRAAPAPAIRWYGTVADEAPADDDAAMDDGNSKRPRRKAALTGEAKRRTGVAPEDMRSDPRCERAHYVADDVDRTPADGLDAPVQQNAAGLALGDAGRGGTSAARGEVAGDDPPLVSGQVLCDHCGDRLIVGLDVVASCRECNSTEVPFDICDVCYDKLVEDQRAHGAASAAAAAYDAEQKAKASSGDGAVPRKRARKPPKPRRASPFHACPASQFRVHAVDACPTCGKPLLTRPNPDDRQCSTLVFACTCQPLGSLAVR